LSIGYLYFSENLNWAAQNLRHGSRVGHSWFTYMNLKPPSQVANIHTESLQSKIC